MRKFLLFYLLCLPALASQADEVSNPVGLRDNLPADTVAYLRIPSFWGMLSAPKGNVLQAPLNDAAHREQLAKVDAGLYENALKEAGELLHPALPWLHRLRSPLEAAVLLPENTPPPLASVLIRARLNFADAGKLGEWLNQLAEVQPELQLAQPFDETGKARLLVGGMPALLDYRAETGVLSMLSGAAVEDGALEQILQNLAPIPDRHPLPALEQRVDQSGQGLFFWADLKRLAPMLQAGMPPAQASMLHRWGLLSLESLAAGWGVSEGKGRLRMLVTMPPQGYREHIAVPSNRLDLGVIGEPGLLFSLSLPLLEWQQSFEKIMAEEQLTEQKLWLDYLKFKQDFQENLGLELDTLLKAVGPEILIFTDRGGEYLALRLRDADSFGQVVDALVNKFDLTHETREVNGQTLHHLVTPGLPGLEKQTPADPAEAFLYKLAGRIGSHYYWGRENDYLIMAQVPQSLMDRAKLAGKPTLDTWLRASQKQQPEHALLMVSTRFEHVPRYVYYAYLQFLLMLGDLADTPVDLFKLPSASQLNLPDEGAYSLQLDWARDRLELSLNFENNPLEWVLGSDITTVAVVGVLAAVAIPAYTDYLKRAKVAEGMSLLGGLKTPAEEFLASKDRLPGVEEISGKTAGKYTAKLYLLEDGSGYAAEFKPETGLAGRIMLLYDPDTGIWTCTHEGMNKAYLPSACQ